MVDPNHLAISCTEISSKSKSDNFCWRLYFIRDVHGDFKHQPIGEWKLDEGDYTVSVLTWNVLCQSLAHSFDKVDPNHIEWEFRKSLFEKLLFGRSDIMWDFICLQEVDRHQELFVED